MLLWRLVECRRYPVYTSCNHIVGCLLALLFTCQLLLFVSEHASRFDIAGYSIEEGQDPAQETSEQFSGKSKNDTGYILPGTTQLSNDNYLNLVLYRYSQTRLPVRYAAIPTPPPWNSI